MLMLSRYEMEGFTIKCPSGEEIKVTLVYSRERKARIGIDAPQEYVILRNELREPPRRKSEVT